MCSQRLNLTLQVGNLSNYIKDIKKYILIKSVNSELSTVALYLDTDFTNKKKN